MDNFSSSVKFDICRFFAIIPSEKRLLTILLDFFLDMSKLDFSQSCGKVGTFFVVLCTYLLNLDNLVWVYFSSIHWSRYALDKKILNQAS